MSFLGFIFDLPAWQAALIGVAATIPVAVADIWMSHATKRGDAI
ncbi:hypothetical protein [Micromonospora tarapacensis]|nr:hypothetical protein [Micromonospora tarapacensis]